MEPLEGNSGAVHCGSAESMRQVEDGSVTLTVTSPPYYNAMDYERYSPGTKEHKRRTYAKGFGSYEEYLQLMTRCFAEVYRATKPGGHCAIVVGAVIHDSRVYSIPHDLTARLQALGWQFQQEIVWYKTCSALDRAGVFVQHPFPGYWYANCLHEVIIVFRRPGPKLYVQVDEKKKQRSRVPITPLVRSDVLKDVWTIPVVPSGKVEHPCPFPAEIVHRLIVLYSHVGDLVLDPFTGSGTTGQVARMMDRRFVGYELEERFAALARKRIKEPMELRRRQLVIRHDVIVDDPFNKPPPSGGASAP